MVVDMIPKEVCDVCGSDDILQQISFMANPNNPNITCQLPDTWEWDDFYYCNTCEDTCIPKEIEVA